MLFLAPATIHGLAYLAARDTPELPYGGFLAPASVQGRAYLGAAAAPASNAARNRRSFLAPALKDGMALLAPAIVPGQRAIVLLGTERAQVPNQLLGTGLKPLVNDAGTLRQQELTEGVPMIVKQNTLQELGEHDWLLI